MKEHKRLENVFFYSLRNDITGLFKQRVIVFGEHQSTINNNIPVRLFMYAGRIYEQLLDGHKKYETEVYGQRVTVISCKDVIY